MAGSGRYVKTHLDGRHFLISESWIDDERNLAEALSEKVINIISIVIGQGHFTDAPRWYPPDYDLTQIRHQSNNGEADDAMGRINLFSIIGRNTLKIPEFNIELEVVAC